MAPPVLLKPPGNSNVLGPPNVSVLVLHRLTRAVPPQVLSLMPILKVPAPKVVVAPPPVVSPLVKLKVPAPNVVVPAVVTCLPKL